MGDDNKIKRSIEIGEASSVGIEIVIAIVIGAVGGMWLDRRFGTEPWLTLLGIIAGIGAAVKAVMRIIKKINRDDNDQNQNGGNNDGGD